MLARVVQQLHRTAHPQRLADAGLVVRHGLDRQPQRLRDLVDAAAGEQLVQVGVPGA